MLGYANKCQIMQMHKDKIGDRHKACPRVIGDYCVAFKVYVMLRQLTPMNR